MQRATFAITITTLYLLVYVLMIQFDQPFRSISLVFALSPLPMIWMVYEILRHGVYTGRELKHNEEYGYQDRSTESLGPF
jgi:apolipoprotein N-acyltransferase